ncbi:Uncharacterised protein [Mannheimia haemolytica]|nr:Uncharacterised protein [Mannheimia haemolytica]
MQFTYGSICSGIEATSIAWHGLGKPLWFSEIEPFPCAVLAHRFPQCAKWKRYGCALMQWIRQRLNDYLVQSLV